MTREARLKYAYPVRRWQVVYVNFEGRHVSRIYRNAHAAGARRTVGKRVDCVQVVRTMLIREVSP